MKKLRIAIAMVAVASVALTSCISIYQPQSVDIPLIEERGEWRFGLLTGANGLAATATYGLTDLYSAQLYGSVWNGGYYVQAAPGVHWNVSYSGIVEGFAGIGYRGTARPFDVDPFRERDILCRFALPYVQLNAGWRNDRAAEVALGLKVGGFFPSVTRVDYAYDTLTAEPYVASRSRYTEPGLLVEPRIQLRLGRRRFKYTLQMSYAWISSMQHVHYGGYGYNRFSIAHGVTFSF